MEKTILITGATSGIGEATLMQFVDKGWNVVGTYLSHPERAEEITTELDSKNVEFYHLDLLSDPSIEAFARDLKKKYHQIDVLINNAGYVFEKLLKDTTFAEIEKQIGTNLVGMIKLAKTLLPVIGEQVVNIGSKYGSEGHEYYAVYCASKWGVRGFSKALADEYKRLRILTVNPGPTKTKMNNFWDDAVDPFVVAEAIYKAIHNRNYKSGDDINL